MNAQHTAQMIFTSGCVVLAVCMAGKSVSATGAARGTGREAPPLWIFVLCVVVGVVAGYPGWPRAALLSIAMAAGLAGPLFLAARFGEWAGRGILRRSERK
jgi:hypothetical protein